MRLLLLCAALALARLPAFASEAEEAAARAYSDFRQGRAREAVQGYRYLSLLGVSGPQPDLNLALLTRDLGLAEEAQALWVKSSLLEGADGFVWNQRGWADLGLDRPREAKLAFLKGVERSSTTASQAEAMFGMGMAELVDAHPKAAARALREALLKSPFIIPAAAEQLAKASLADGETHTALAYLRQSVSLDPTQAEALRALAAVNRKIGDNQAAWQAYHRLLALNPTDEAAGKGLKKVLRYLPENLESLRAARRLSRPLLDAGGKGALGTPKSTSTLRVALFSDPEGRPARTRRLYFMCNAPFRVIAANGEVAKDDGRAFDQWEAIFRPESNLVELRDTMHNIQYTSKQAFQIAPNSRFGSVLVKSAEFDQPFGFDPGDRELRGRLELLPGPSGFRLVNQLPLEDYLFGAVAAALPSGSPREAFKAQAVFSRTLAVWHQSHRLPNQENADICDSSACQAYLGLNAEMRSATEAVLETEGMVLKFNGEAPKLIEHDNCGGLSEEAPADDPALSYLDAVSDGPAPVRLASVLDLERWLHEYPPPDRYCEAGALGPHSGSRWIRVLDADDLQERAEKIKPMGLLRHIQPLKRSATGRVMSLRVEGSRGATVLEGEKTIAAFLSPGSLRSMLFSVQPVRKGGRPTHFIIWGAGAGHGLGLCKAGAIGQASLGRGFTQILAQYFPRLRLESLASKAREARLGPAPAGRRLPKNPRFKKKK